MYLPQQDSLSELRKRALSTLKANKRLKRNAADIDSTNSKTFLEEGEIIESSDHDIKESEKKSDCDKTNFCQEDSNYSQTPHETQADDDFCLPFDIITSEKESLNIQKTININLLPEDSFSKDKRASKRKVKVPQDQIQTKRSNQSIIWKKPIAFYDSNDSFENPPVYHPVYKIPSRPNNLYQNLSNRKPMNPLSPTIPGKVHVLKSFQKAPQTFNSGNFMNNIVPNEIHKPLNKSRSDIPTKHNKLILNYIPSVDCPLDNANLDELIHAFNMGELNEHKKKVLGTKILQELAAKNMPTSFFESQVKIDDLKIIGVEVQETRDIATETQFKVSTPSTHIDRSFALNRVNTLLSRFAVSKITPTDKNKANIDFISTQLEKCNASTISPLIDFGGYFQSSERIAWPSDTVEVDLVSNISSDKYIQKQAVEKILSQNLDLMTQAHMCLNESDKECCLSLDCIYRHHCDIGIGSDFDLQALLTEVYKNNSNKDYQNQIKEILQASSFRQDEPFKVIQQIRHHYRRFWKISINNVPEFQTPDFYSRQGVSSKSVHDSTENNQASNFYKVSCSKPDFGTLYAELKPPSIFREFENFIQAPNSFKDLRSVFAHPSEKKDKSDASKQSKLLDMLKTELANDNTSKPTRSIEVLASNLKNGSTEKFLWFLYFSLIIRYRLLPLKDLVAAAFSKHPRLHILHWMCFQASVKLTEKVSVLQKIMDVSFKKGAKGDLVKRSSFILNTYVNFFALITSYSCTKESFLYSYAQLISGPQVEDGFNKVFSQEIDSYPQKFNVKNSYVSGILIGADFASFWLIYIYYLGFQGLPPVFGESHLTNFVKNYLFEINWSTTSDISEINKNEIIRIFLGLSSDWPSVLSKGYSVLVTIFRNFAGFAIQHASSQLTRVEKICRHIIKQHPHYGEFHEILFSILLSKSKSVDHYWENALVSSGHSLGLYNFYAKVLQKETINKVAIRKALVPPEFEYLFENPQTNLFSSIIHINSFWEQNDESSTQEFLCFYAKFFQDAENSTFDELKFDYIRCLNLVQDDMNLIKSLEFLDEALSSHPKPFFPSLLNSADTINIGESYDYAFVERIILYVADLCLSSSVKLDIINMACTSYPGSFDLFLKLEALKSELNQGKTPIHYVPSFPIAAASWKVLFKYLLDKKNGSFNPKEFTTLIAEGKQCFSLIPSLYSLL